MTKQDDYRSLAKKSLLLALAERWLELADAHDTRAKG
jgi:hypothetical protein